MSQGLNKVMLIGHLGADPELRSTNSGTSILRLRVATSETYLDRDKNRQTKTEWHSCTIWGARAEALHAILTKGKMVYIEGKLRTSSYDDKEGVKRYKTEINVDEIILCGGGQGGGGEGSQGGGPRAGGGRQQRPPSDQGGDETGGFAGGEFAGDDDSIPF